PAPPLVPATPVVPAAPLVPAPLDPPDPVPLFDLPQAVASPTPAMISAVMPILTLDMSAPVLGLLGASGTAQSAIQGGLPSPADLWSAPSPASGRGERL